MTNNIFESTTGLTMRSSPTMSAANMAKEAEKRGKKVEIVTVGDLFPKPTAAETGEWLAQLKQQAANTSEEMFATLRPEARAYAYSETAGLPSLRAAVAFTFTRDTGIEATSAEVCVGTGGKGALNGAFFNTVKPGEKVFLAAPGWPTNYDMFAPGVVLVEIATGDGILRAGALTAAIKAHGEPALILINAPSNPTGANYTREEREAFFAAVTSLTKNTVVASDDPYGKLIFRDEPYDIRAVLQRGAAEKALFATARLACFRTASKEYGLAGERVGFVITKHAGMLMSLQRWNENKGGGMGVRNQELAQAALLFGDQFIIRTVTQLTEKRKILTDGIGALKYASMNAPGGTIYGWVDFAGLQGKTVTATQSETGAAYRIDTPADMMRYLVNVAGVCGVPGTPFYAVGSPAAAADWHVRISFCCEKAQLERVISNLAGAEAQLEGNSRRAAS